MHYKWKTSVNIIKDWPIKFCMHLSTKKFTVFAPGAMVQIIQDFSDYSPSNPFINWCLQTSNNKSRLIVNGVSDKCLDSKIMHETPLQVHLRALVPRWPSRPTGLLFMKTAIKVTVTEEVMLHDVMYTGTVATN